MIIALFALVVSVYSVYESRKNNLLSQEPHIVAHEIESESEYRFQITNKGGGPAFFEKVEYFNELEKLEGEDFRLSIREVLIKNGIKFKSTIVKFGAETVMAPGETFVIIKLEVHHGDTKKMRELPNAVFGVKIHYKSLHGKSKVWVNDERIKFI